MRDWLDYKYTHIDDGRSIRLYYPTRSKYSKAKWWIGFLLCISIPERFYRAQFYFDYCFCCSYYWWLAFPVFFSFFFFFIFDLLLLLPQPIFLQSKIKPYTTLALFVYLRFWCIVNIYGNAILIVRQTFFRCCCCFLENSMQVFSCCGRVFFLFAFSLEFGSLIPAQSTRILHTDAICIRCSQISSKYFLFAFFSAAFYNNQIFWMRAPAKTQRFNKQFFFSYSSHDQFHSHFTYTTNERKKKQTYINRSLSFWIETFSIPILIFAYALLPSIYLFTFVATT